MTVAVREPVIDVHTHCVPRGWPELGDHCGGSGWPTLRVDSEREAMILLDDVEFRRIHASSWDAGVRVADMDADGVDVQVVLPTPVFFGYEREPAQASRAAAVFNDLTLEIVAAAPDRLVPFCQVPLQDLDAACAELDRCLESGHQGVEIGNHVGSRDLDDVDIVAFLQHCASADVPVFVHPWDMPTGPRLDRWMARWLVGMPAETHLSVLAMILGGVFDDIDESLRICFAHGAASFAAWTGRVDNAWLERADVVGMSERRPSAYVDRFYVDSLVFEEPTLRLLVDVFGVERVLLGSDYPYPLGERPVGRAVRQSPSLSEGDKDLILRQNPAVFLGREPALTSSHISTPPMPQERDQP